MRRAMLDNSCTGSGLDPAKNNVLFELFVMLLQFLEAVDWQ